MQPLDKAPSTKRFGSFEVDLRARAADERDPALIYVAVVPRLAPLRQDKRYGELIQEMRL